MRPEVSTPKNSVWDDVKAYFELIKKKEWEIPYYCPKCKKLYFRVKKFKNSATVRCLRCDHWLRLRGPDMVGWVVESLQTKPDS